MKRILFALVFAVLASLLLSSTALADGPDQVKVYNPSTGQYAWTDKASVPALVAGGWIVVTTTQPYTYSLPSYSPPSYPRSSYSPPSYTLPAPSYRDNSPAWGYSNNDVDVRGYYRKDRTYVKPYSRTKPDGNPYNNYSYPGNYNPNTGKTSTGSTSGYLKKYRR